MNTNNTYEKRFSELKNVVLSNVGILETYIVSDVHARFSIYLVATEDFVLNKLKEELSDLYERIELIDKVGFIYQDLNNPNYEKPNLISEEPQKVFFVDRHINLLNWSLRNNRFESKAPITCFYSFKGGLGRTTAMVLTGIALARQGKRVALLDFDLEAPGLVHLFSADFEDLKKFRGILDYLVDLSNMRDPSLLDLSDYYYTINRQDIVGSNGGELIIFSAGQFSGEENLYMSKFSKLNSIFQTGSNSLIDRLLSEIEIKVAPDSVLIDTRTGLNDWGGLFLTRYAKNAFLFFYGTPQNMFGLETLLPHLKQQTSLKFYLVNSPVPQLEELAKQEQGYYLERSYNLFSDFYYAPGQIPFIEDDTAPHYPIDVPYSDLAVLLNSSEKLRGLIDQFNGNNPYQRMALLITDIKPEISSIIDSHSIESKRQILEVFSKIAPESAAAEYEFQDLGQLIKNFYPRKDYRFIFDKTKYLILGEKGVGKTALYAVLKVPQYAKALAAFCEINTTELQTTEWIKGLDEKGKEFPLPSTFSEIGKQGEESQRVFWKRLILLQFQKESIESWSNFAQDNPTIKEADIDEQIIQLNDNLESENKFAVVVYDYLDKQIHGADVRGKLISALLEVWRDIHNRYSNLRCKIFLRKDIFEREVHITDKVKLSNHSAEIKWEYDQLLNVVWKRVKHQMIEGMSGTPLQEWFNQIDMKNLGETLGYLPLAAEKDNRDLLTKLIGEYMGGNNKAFPYNWILYHVSDTKRAIHPRSLLNLFSQAAKLQLEANDFETQFYLKPKYMEFANIKVSEGRVTDIKEEYPELRPVFEKLRDHIQRFPADENDLNTALRNLIDKESMANTDVADLKSRMEDAGILYEYKFNRKGTAKKYHIPDLYLIGMGLSRIGPGAHKALFGKK